MTKVVFVLDFLALGIFRRTECGDDSCLAVQAAAQWSDRGQAGKMEELPPMH